MKLYRFLTKIGLTPNKTKTIGRLKIPKRFFADFLRGHLDGDGYTYSFWDSRWKNSFRFYSAFLSASKKHLEWLKEEVKNLYAVEGTIRFKGKSTYELQFAKKSTIKLMGKIYYQNNLVCLSRKHSKIESALSIITRQADVL